MLKSGIAGSQLVLLLLLFFFFKETYILFSIMVIQIYILTRTGEGVEHPLQHLLFVVCLVTAIPNRCKMISHSGFDLHLPDE